MVPPFLLVLVIILHAGRPRTAYGNQIRKHALSEAARHVIKESRANDSYPVLENIGKLPGVVNRTLTFLNKVSKDLLAEYASSDNETRRIYHGDMRVESTTKVSSRSLNLNQAFPQTNKELMQHQETVTSTLDGSHLAGSTPSFPGRRSTEGTILMRRNSTGKLQKRAYIIPPYYDGKPSKNLIQIDMDNGTTTVKTYTDSMDRTSNGSVTAHDLNRMQTSERASADGIQIAGSFSTKTNLTLLNKSTNFAGKNPRKNQSENASTENIFKRWKDLEKAIKFRTDSVLKKALPRILAYKTDVNVSASCTASVIQLVSGLRNLKSWAIRMVDASGRFPSGSLAGTFTDLGDYDQCLDILYSPSKKSKKKARGQYCTLELKPLMPSLGDGINLYSHALDFGNTSKDSVLSDLSHASTLFYIMVLRIGICVPSLCSENDIKQLAAVALKKIPVGVSVRNCEVKTPVKLTVAQIIILSFALLIVLLIVIGTLMHHYFIRRIPHCEAREGRFRLSIEAFSATANLRQLMKRSGRSSMLASVNGIRCLSLVWIVLAHTYGFGHRQGLARLSNARQYMDDIPFQIITNAWVSVDTFFMLGGLLVAMPNLKSMDEKNGKINFLYYILHRIWRLIPPVAATVGIMFLLPLIGSGPLWKDMVGHKVANCERGWWQAILPINTWINFDNMCLLHTWYIAADLHFYCLSPFILILLYRWPLLGFAALLLITVSCAIVSGLLTFLYKLPPTVIFFSPDVQLTKKTANLLYFRPYPHMGAYCVGIVLGYILWKYRKVVVNWPTQLMGWSLSAVSCFAVLFATYPWNRNQMPASATCVIYAMTHRTVWAAGVAWVIYMCATGRGGILNQFLSWQLFGPLSRLSYSIYLLHFPRVMDTSKLETDAAQFPPL